MAGQGDLQDAAQRGLPALLRAVGDLLIAVSDPGTSTSAAETASEAGPSGNWLPSRPAIVDQAAPVQAAPVQTPRPVPASGTPPRTSRPASMPRRPAPPVPDREPPLGTTAEDEIEFVLADARVRAHELIDESIAKAEELLKRRRLPAPAPLDTLREDIARIAADVRGLHTRLDRIESMLRTSGVASGPEGPGAAAVGTSPQPAQPSRTAQPSRPLQPTQVQPTQAAARVSGTRGPIQPLEERESPPPSPWPTPPESLTPETVTPESLTPETLAPETLAPETLAPEKPAPETPAPETVGSVAAQPAPVDRTATTSNEPLNGAGTPYPDVRQQYMTVPASAVPPTVSRADDSSGPAIPQPLVSRGAATLTPARNGVVHAAAPAGGLAPTTAGEPIGRLVVLFRPSAGAVVLRVAPVVGFQGLMRLQRALTDLTEVREAGIEGYSRGEARLRVQLAAELDP